MVSHPETGSDLPNGSDRDRRRDIPVQRRLCPIFVRNVGSPDIQECFRGLTGSQRTPGFGASQLGIRAYVYEYLGSSGLGIHHH